MSEKSGLKFDPATHTYTVGPLTYPSVTQILEDVGMIDKTWFTEEGADRGTRIHRAIEDFDNNTLNWDEVGEDIVPYIMAWSQYKEDKKIEVLESEVMFAHGYYKYAGTIDKLVKENNKNGIREIKTGQPQKWHRLQAVAYYSGYNNYIERKHHQPIDLDIIYLRKNGKYQAVGVDYMGTVDVWECALKLYRWKYD